ncbi:glycosyl hydrolase [Spirochaetia bacterium]|nr:glycosyl hydrolase [Spirochaetia bacterium]
MVRNVTALPAFFRALCLGCVLFLSAGSAPAPVTPTLKQKIAQMLMVGFRGTELTKDNHIYRDISELGIGGVLIFDYDMPSRSRPRNILSKEQLAKLTADMQSIAPVKLFIAIDQEGGRVNRLRSEYGFPPNIRAKDMAADPRGALTKAQAEETAALLAEMGINLNFAPCVDLDLNPANPIIGAYGRSFSADPKTVIKHASIWIEAHRRRGIISCIKHFPGHGSSTGDTHRGQVDITGLWQEAELIPYQKLISSRSMEKSLMVMTSHVFNANLDRENPATLSAPILSGLLRNKLGYRGIIVSDDMDMAAIKANYAFDEALEKAVNAGVDLLCLSNNGGLYDPALAQKAADALYDMVQKGRIKPERIEESWNRIMAVKKRM